MEILSFDDSEYLYMKWSFDTFSPGGFFFPKPEGKKKTENCLLPTDFFGRPTLSYVITRKKKPTPFAQNNFTKNTLTFPLRECSGIRRYYLVHSFDLTTLQLLFSHGDFNIISVRSPISN